MDVMRLDSDGVVRVHSRGQHPYPALVASRSSHRYEVKGEACRCSAGSKPQQIDRPCRFTWVSAKLHGILRKLPVFQTPLGGTLSSTLGTKLRCVELLLNGFTSKERRS
ncbi:hypothetical protein GOP47_0009224 [Adiantum capillus-veneris]|uniref:Uncharacterized protein n=1 Tax=Adiantum capillus-veneris TaxID=13818 RepID=A0A9D4UW72_ADICA|nr:hypothetical protein GOP47_0009224 [Adiantum capillus-veneris]